MILSKQFSLFAVSILIFTLFSSCDNQRTSQTKKASVQESVRLMADSISEDLSKQGPIAWLHYFHRSPQFFMVSDGKLELPNNDSADVLVQHLTQQIKEIKLIWNDIRVDSLSSELAVMAASFHEVFTYIGGRHSASFRGYFTGLVENTPSGWRLRDAHWSLDHSRK